MVIVAAHRWNTTEITTSHLAAYGLFTFSKTDQL